MTSTGWPSRVETLESKAAGGSLTPPVSGGPVTSRLSIWRSEKLFRFSRWAKKRTVSIGTFSSKGTSALTWPAASTR